MITFNSTPNNIAFGALVPKKDYAGPILKLTKNEKAKIFLVFVYSYKK